MPKPTESRAEDYRRLFKKLDIKNEGRLTSKNIDLEKLKKYTPYPENFISDADNNDDGIITEEEFIQYCHENETRIKKIFDEIDTKNDGILDRQELRKAFQNANIKFTEDQLSATISQLDKSGDKMVEKADFVYHYLLVNCSKNWSE